MDFDPINGYNRWYYVLFSASKRIKRSEICLKINNDPYVCEYVDSYFDETWLEFGEIELGGDHPPEKFFKGYMRKVMIYDWPQKEISVDLRVREEP